MKGLKWKHSDLSACKCKGLDLDATFNIDGVQVLFPIPWLVWF